MAIKVISRQTRRLTWEAASQEPCLIRTLRNLPYNRKWSVKYLPQTLATAHFKQTRRTSQSIAYTLFVNASRFASNTLTCFQFGLFSLMNWWCNGAS
jgi:hypothetical protein